MDRKPHTDKQLRMLFALAKRCGMDTEELHSVAERITGETSLKALDVTQAKRIIDALQMMCGQGTGNIPQRATKAQKGYIYILLKELGWMDEPGRARTFLEKKYGVSSVEFLPDNKVQACITALRNMVKRGYGKEKETNEKPVD